MAKNKCKSEAEEDVIATEESVASNIAEDNKDKTEGEYSEEEKFIKQLHLIEVADNQFFFVSAGRGMLPIKKEIATGVHSVDPQHLNMLLNQNVKLRIIE